jgi:hypothetical protein
MKYDGFWKNVLRNNDEAKLKYMQDNLLRNKEIGGQEGDPYIGKGFTRVIRSFRLMDYAHQLGPSRQPLDCLSWVV